MSTHKLNYIIQIGQRGNVKNFLHYVLESKRFALTAILFSCYNSYANRMVPPSSKVCHHHYRHLSHHYRRLHHQRNCHYHYNYRYHHYHHQYYFLLFHYHLYHHRYHHFHHDHYNQQLSLCRNRCRVTVTVTIAIIFIII